MQLPLSSPALISLSCVVVMGLMVKQLLQLSTVRGELSMARALIAIIIARGSSDKQSSMCLGHVT